ncbi:hypothetical protein PTKIN_Ptkin19aG0128100 [Pterospermum kingtungense]
MKRASLNSHRQYDSLDEDARAKLKYQNLLQEFLELQKEFVSKKKKLQTVNQKRETLLAEVRFLRQRYRYLSKIKSAEHELQQDSVQSQNPYLQSKTAKNIGINEAVEGIPGSLPDLDTDMVLEEGGGRSQVQVVVQAPLRKEKKPKKGLINGKTVEKKKISWLDQDLIRSMVAATFLVFPLAGIQLSTDLEGEDCSPDMADLIGFLNCTKIIVMLSQPSPVAVDGAEDAINCLLNHLGVNLS